MAPKTLSLAGSPPIFPLPSSRTHLKQSIEGRALIGIVGNVKGARNAFHRHYSVFTTEESTDNKLAHVAVADAKQERTRTSHSRQASFRFNVCYPVVVLHLCLCMGGRGNEGAIG